MSGHECRTAFPTPRLFRIWRTRATDPGRSSISGLEWEVLAMIDGNNALSDIAAALALSEFEVAKSVYGMISTELIEVGGRMRGATHG